MQRKEKKDANNFADTFIALKKLKKCGAGSLLDWRISYISIPDSKICVVNNAGTPCMCIKEFLKEQKWNVH